LEKKKEKKQIVDLSSRVYDSVSKTDISVSTLINMFKSGELLFKHDLELKNKQDRRKLNRSLKNYIAWMFIDSFMQKETIHGAIEHLIKRDKDGEYLFKKVSYKIKTINQKDDKKRKLQEYKFLQAQVRERWVNLNNVKKQVKIIKGPSLNDPDHILLWAQPGYEKIEFLLPQNFNKETFQQKNE